MLITAKESTVVHIKPGLYPAHVLRAYEDHIDNSTFGAGDVLRLDLVLDNMLNDKGEAVVLDAIANPVLTPKSKLWGWCEALAMTPFVGMQLNTDDLETRPCTIEVRDKLANDGSGTVFSVVARLTYAMSGQGPSQGPAPTAAEAPPLLRPDGAVDFTQFWVEATKRGITQTMVKAQLETADLNELSAMPPLDVLELLTVLRPQQ